MKHPEFYVKYKTNYPPLVNPVFSKRNWWRIVLITVVAILIEPLVMYKNQRSVPISFEYYLQLIEYFIIIAVPFVAFLLWVNWRELIKRRKGYGWVGKFEVIGKRSSLLFCYLLLMPDSNHKLRVDRSFFQKTRIGDFIQVKRDAFENIEEVSRIKNISNRLASLARAF